MSWSFKSAEDLRAAGYTASNTSTCSGPTCGARIEWWITPNDKKLPLNVETYLPHWATCPDRQRFGKSKPKSAPEEKTAELSLTFACRAMECHTEISKRDIFCVPHWAMVPEPMQKMIIQHFDPEQPLYKQPSTSFNAALNAAIIYIRKYELNLKTKGAAA